MQAYFETVGLLLVVYCLARWLVWMELRPPKAGPPSTESDASPGNALDASTLCDRLHQVRHDYLADLPAGSQSFKKPLLVESKRAEVAKQAFFHKPPEPKPDEPDDGLTLLLV